MYIDDTLIYTEGTASGNCRDNMINDIKYAWLHMKKFKINEKRNEEILETLFC